MARAPIKATESADAPEHPKRERQASLVFAHAIMQQSGRRVNTERQLRVVELCAGAGGQALGFEAAGFAHDALVELDPFACDTLRLNRPLWAVVEADLNEVDLRRWDGTDVLAAGLPCPPFSVAGKQLGAGDDRDLFPALLRHVAAVHPRAVLVENVRGLMARRFDAFRYNVEQSLTEMGYAVTWGMLDARDFGVPQTRTRSFMVAVQGDVFSFPLPSTPGDSVGAAIGDLMAQGGWQWAAAWAEQADEVAPTIVGGSAKHGGPDLGPTRARAAWATMGVDGLGLADAPPSEAHAGMPRLTIPMVARLQAFPDDWKFAGGKTRQYRQIGNALPPPLAEAMASALAACLA